MANFIETLFGLAIASTLAASVLAIRRRGAWARRLGIAAGALAIAGAALELYSR